MKHANMIHTKEIRIYRLLLCVLSPILLIGLLREAWQQRSISWFSARLGKTTAIQADLWLHCASVGEVNAVAPLVQALHDQGKTLLITTFTPTGQKQAQRRFVSLTRLHIRTLPFDWAWTTQRFLASVTCPNLWLVETELWPMLMLQAKQHNMNIQLINARITQKTSNTPHWWQRLLLQLLNQAVSTIACRNEQDLNDFKQLGVADAQLRVLGNLKWCDSLPDSLPRLYHQPYVVFASTHAPEEITLAKLWQNHPSWPQLVVVPRHPKRGDAIAQRLQQAHIPYSQRSQQHVIDSNAIILADTFGELQAWMAHAELVIMGGSFAPKGGQNPLEAIRLGKVVLCGPDMRDFLEEVTALLSTSALIQVETMLSLVSQIDDLLAQPEARQQRGLVGKAWLANNQGQVLANYLNLLEQSHGVS